MQEAGATLAGKLPDLRSRRGLEEGISREKQNGAPPKGLEGGGAAWGPGLGVDLKLGGRRPHRIPGGGEAVKRRAGGEEKLRVKGVICETG